MRILVNTRFLLKDKLEGIGLYTFEVLKRLVDRYPEHEFYFAFDRPFDSRFCFGVNVFPLVLFPPARHPFLFWWWFEVAIPRAYKQFNCDAFFSPDGFTTLSKAIAKNVITIHDLAYLHYPQQVRGLMRQYYRRFIPKFIDQASSVITVSQASHDDIISYFPKAGSKTTWVYNGVSHSFVGVSPEDAMKVKQVWSSAQDYFIMIGAIHPRKNIPRTVNAFTEFKKRTGSKTKLLIVGRKGWKSDASETSISQSSESQDIHQTGYVSDDDLALLLASSKGLLYTSLFEGFGLPIAAAMKCEIPVLTSDRSSMIEVAGEAALLADPTDSESIVKCLIRLDNDEDLRSSLIQAGKVRANDFDWDITANHLAKILFD